LTRFATKEIYNERPAQGLPSGIYQHDSSNFFAIEVPVSEKSVNYIEHWKTGRMDQHARAFQGRFLTLWMAIVCFLLIETWISRRVWSRAPEAVTVGILLVFSCMFSTAALARGSQIEVLESEGVDFKRVYAKLVDEVSRRTSVELDRELVTLRALQPSELVRSPYLYRRCRRHGAFSKEGMLGSELLYEQKIIYLDGIVTYDGCMPEGSVQLPSDHPLFRSFYLIGSRTGCGLEKVYGDSYSRLTKRLSFPDGLMGHAFPSTPNACTEGWIRLTVNWVMYLFSSDYKNDQVHVPFLLERIR
jgi:hypothetical protein